MTRMKMIAALLLAATLAAAGPAAAQNKDFFVPGKPAAPAPHPVARPTPPPSAPGPGAAQQAPPPIPMPPVPELPALPKGAAPPAAVVGVIDVPEVMRASTAAQQVDRVISERRQKLSDDAQKEQGTWREMQQTLTNERAKLSPAQIRAKEQELQDRITKAQIEFRKRNEIIQEAAQVGLNQIQATLIAVIRQVAESRGMNLVLHRAQVALNINEFDVTQQVLTELNTILPSVVVPPEGVSPVGKKVEPVKLVAQPAAPAAPAAAAPAKPAAKPAAKKP